MANTIRIKRSSVPGKVPLAADLVLGEMAINTHDGVLYIKRDNTSSGGSESVVAIGQFGYTGSQGYSGSQGYTGSRGSTGFTGSQGIQGSIGFTGSQGVQGIQGIQGFTGSQGVIGFTGSQGIQGVQGVNGYTGSQGIQGVQGLTGYTGSQGAIGYTGSQGVIGYTGSRGFTGSQGNTGFTGSQGTQGLLGYTGSQGVIGFTGSIGGIGYTGSQGDQGSIGYTGSSGQIAIQDATPPTALYEGQIWFDSSSLKTYVWYDNFWVEIGSTDVSPIYSRAAFSLTTPVIAQNITHLTSFSAYKSYALLSVYVNSAAWIRIYTDVNSQTADANRLINQDALPGSGVIAEIITASEKIQKITPFVVGGNLDSPPTESVYLSITNLSSNATTITVSLSLIRMEI